MDVANTHHLDELDYGSDITFDAITEIRRRTATHLEGETFTLISSAAPDAPIGQEFRMHDGVLQRV